MPWQHTDIRRLLSLLQKPHELESDTLAAALCKALRTSTVHSAILMIIRRAFEIDTPLSRSMREVVELCDVAGLKVSQAAAQMSISTRTLFRLRAAAMSSIASTVKKVLYEKAPVLTLKHSLARIVAPVDSAVAYHLLEREAECERPQAAYEAICLAIGSGREPEEALLRRCTGQWSFLVHLEIARSGLLRGDAEVFESGRTKARENLLQGSAPMHFRAEYEMAYLERADALRRCDVKAMRRMTERMIETAGSDPLLNGLAMVCNAEQACEEGNLEAARGFIGRLEEFCATQHDYRIIARTAHVGGVEKFLLGRYAEAIELAEAAGAAMVRVAPGIALCAAAYAGRSAVLLQRAWSRPTELCRVFPSFFQTGFTDLVWARHLAESDPAVAMTVVDRAMAVIVSQNAPGALAYARATRSLALELLGQHRKAQAERVRAWAEAVRLGSATYLYDLFAHPVQTRQEFGPFLIDARFADAVQLRIKHLGNQAIDANAIGRVAAPLFDFLRGTSGKRRGSRSFFMPNLEQISLDLSWCLPPADRAAFIDRILSAGVSDDYCRPPRSAKPVAI